ncbi:MAG: phage protein Gp27 family protein [Pseudomonadota bacterium]|nr:phage protein Gp27 family protein [Pseudomonadota bacterium]
MDAARNKPARRTGRGVLSSIERLPAEFDQEVAWVNAELAERRMTQAEILRQFNERLQGKGMAPISKGAFSRYSVRTAQQRQKILASHKILDSTAAREIDRAVPRSKRREIGNAEVFEAMRAWMIKLLYADEPSALEISSAAVVICSILSEDD